MNADKLANNAVLTVLARGAMLIGTGIGLPVAGWMMTRLVTSADTISGKVDQTALQVQLLQQSVKFGFDATKAETGALHAQVADHEGRLRVIELGERRPFRP